MANEVVKKEGSQGAEKGVVIVGEGQPPAVASVLARPATTPTQPAVPAKPAVAQKPAVVQPAIQKPAAPVTPLAKAVQPQPVTLPPKVTTAHLEPVVQERRLWNLNNVLAAFIIGAILVIIEFVAMPYFGLTMLEGIMLGLALLVIYAVILFFLLEPRILREVKYTQVKTIEQPVVKEIEKPVIKEVIKTIEKPVIKEVVKEVPVVKTVEKPVIKYVERPVVKVVPKPIIRYVEKPRKKLEIPKYDYTGSTETKVYHTRYCRLGKLIKKKYALHANTQAFFKKRKFRPCEVCILKTKKV